MHNLTITLDINPWYAKQIQLYFNKPKFRMSLMKIKPFLKWAGGKYRCLEHILPMLPASRRLIEPFTGSGVIFINTDYEKYLLGEQNADLIQLFTQIKNEGLMFIDYCEQWFCPQNNAAAQYYAIRSAFNACDNPRLRSAFFLYLNRHGYNGLCRYNSKGQYNVPFGHYKKPYFPRDELLVFYKKIQHATLIHDDFRTTFAHAQTGDTIYCDPPYAPLVQTSNFTRYNGKKFDTKEQITLCNLAHGAAKRGINVIISNHDTAFTRDQYRHSDIRTFPVRRSISCNPAQRVQVNELIAIFYGH